MMENQAIKQRNDELFAKLAKCQANTQEYRTIVAEIAQNNVGLVHYIAKTYFPLAQSDKILASDDLIAEGYFGLLKAIESFKIEKGVPFTNYAGLRIKGHMLDYCRHEAKHKTISLEDDKDGETQKLKDALLSPINFEKDITDQDEITRQMNWVIDNLDQLPRRQKKILTARYLSGEANLANGALAQKLGCTQANVTRTESSAIKKLREIYYTAHPEEVVTKTEVTLTVPEKIVLKRKLKDLIATQLTPQQKKVMLCKFYSATHKSYEQVAKEVNTPKTNVFCHISQACKKLCTLCDSVKDKNHLKSILEFIPEENEKMC